MRRLVAFDITVKATHKFYFVFKDIGLFKYQKYLGQKWRAVICELHCVQHVLITLKIFFSLTLKPKIENTTYRYADDDVYMVYVLVLGRAGSG